ncbi:uncharacterized protein METZ01_LOCUS350776, partial [marine metagenome]
VRLGPTLRDWFVIVSGALFTVACIFMIAKTNELRGYAFTAFFGGGTAFYGWAVWGKIQAQRAQSFDDVRAIGSVRLQANPRFHIVMALWLCVTGPLLALAAIERSNPVMTWGGWIVGGFGVFLLIWHASGRSAQPFLQFEPEGLRIGQRKYSFLLAWDNIATVTTGMRLEHPALFFTVHNRAQLLATSVIHIPRKDGTSPIVELLEANRLYYERDIVIIPFQYGTNITLLAKSIQTY